MVMFLALHPMESISLNSFVLLDFNIRNKLLTQKLLKQGYQYHKLHKTVSKFYRQYYDLISKFQVGLKSLLRQGLSEPEYYCDLVYKLKRIDGSNNFSAQFIKIISCYKKIQFNSIQFNDLFTCHLMYKHKIQTYKHNTKVHKLLLKSYETR